MMMNLGIILYILNQSLYFYFSDEELIIKDNDRKNLFDEINSPTKTDSANLREKKAHVLKVTSFLYEKK